MELVLLAIIATAKPSLVTEITESNFLDKLLTTNRTCTLFRNTMIAFIIISQKVFNMHTDLTKDPPSLGTAPPIQFPELPADFHGELSSYMYDAFVVVAAYMLMTRKEFIGVMSTAVPNQKADNQLLELLGRRQRWLA